jgi:hypothetical protein
MQVAIVAAGADPVWAGRRMIHVEFHINGYPVLDVFDKCVLQDQGRRI